MDDDLNIIKSLIAISSGGLPLANVPREFQEMTGSRLNFSQYGFRSIQEMLQSSKEISLIQSSNGTICRVHDTKMSHVASLVERTKKSKSKSKKKARPTFNRHSSRGYSSPSFNRRVNSFDSNRRQPFYPYNRNLNADYRYSASSRPQAVSRVSSSAPNTSSIQQCSQNTSGRDKYESRCKSSISHPSGSSYERSLRNDQRPVQSNSIGSTKHQLKADSSSGWSSDSSDGKEEPRILVSTVGWTSKSAVGKPQTAIKVLNSSIGSQNVSKASVVHKREPNRIPAETKCSSRSDWSSDSGSASSLPKQTLMPPIIQSIQHSNVTSTSKSKSNLSRMCRSDQLKHESSNSDWSTDSEADKRQHLQSSSGPSFVDPLPMSPPLMVGGVGRGKSRAEVDIVKPGRNEVKVNQLKPPSEEVVVTGSPCKRETLTSLKNGKPTILIKVRNDPILKPKGRFSRPSILNFEFIGDFFLRRITESLGITMPHGICRNNLKIKDCVKEVTMNRSTRPVILMVGMTDILMGATFEDMRQNYLSLLDSLSHRELILLTLPVPPSFMNVAFEEKLVVLEKFNRWLLKSKLPAVIETERFLYCDAPFYERPRLSRSSVETFSEEGSWVIIDEINAVVNTMY